MRSRYTAFVRCAIDYLLSTHDESTRAQVDRKAIEDWSKTTAWRGLEIVAVEGGDVHDSEGTVEFVAKGKRGGRTFAQRERSRFVRRDGCWFYVDGTFKTA
jgi:SEC-C motif domain protein